MSRSRGRCGPAVNGLSDDVEMAPGPPNWNRAITCGRFGADTRWDEIREPWQGGGRLIRDDTIGKGPEPDTTDLNAKG